MTEKFKNKYRIPSTRLQNWHYGWNGAYFITICTANREHYFGEIADNKMQLSHVGILADVFWNEIKIHAKNVELGAYVVMPNHVHGILILTGDQYVGIDENTAGDDETGTTDENQSSGENQPSVETTHALSLQSPPQPESKQPYEPPPLPPTIGQKRFQNQGKNTISSIIGGYKSAVSKHARRLGFEFGWQAGFYDHIIRNDESHQKITDYIETNVLNWKNDKFYNPNKCKY